MERKCPNAVQLFLSNVVVQEYNNRILRAEENKIVSVDKDIYILDVKTQNKKILLDKLHKMTNINTGDIPCEIIFVIDKYYILTTNVDVSDGLANGSKLCQVDRNEDSDNKIIWMLFQKKLEGKSEINGKVIWITILLI